MILHLQPFSSLLLWVIPLITFVTADQIFNSTSAQVAKSKIMSKKQACIYQGELDDGKFHKSGNGLGVEDMRKRIKELRRYNLSLVPHRQHALDKKLAKYEAQLEEHVTAEANRVI